MFIGANRKIFIDIIYMYIKLEYEHKLEEVVSINKFRSNNLHCTKIISETESMSLLRKLFTKGNITES